MIPMLNPGDSFLDESIPVNVLYRRRNYFKQIKRMLWGRIVDEGCYRCESCGSSRHLTLHHKVPLEFGGSNEPENIEPLCSICHQMKHRQFGIRYGRNSND